MIKEIWILARMLFKNNPCDVSEVKLLGTNHIPFKGYAYIMWCGNMIYRNDMFEKRQKEWMTVKFEIQKRHETIHLLQAKSCGSWVKYYWKYLCEWIKGNPIMAPASSAYKAITDEAARRETAIAIWDKEHPDLARQDFILSTGMDEDGNTVEIPESTGRPKSLLPVTLKLGESKLPKNFCTFATLVELQEFFSAGVDHLIGAYSAGWYKIATFDWMSYVQELEKL